ncbi:hypothetical protein FJ950_15235 [Mesorhizobium sp. B2-3-14]|nr:hypothetical protein FJ950_15235 [Mesorhizobium sp. B2-3-14]
MELGDFIRYIILVTNVGRLTCAESLDFS